MRYRQFQNELLKLPILLYKPIFILKTAQKYKKHKIQEIKKGFLGKVAQLFFLHDILLIDG